MSKPIKYTDKDIEAVLSLVRKTLKSERKNCGNKITLEIPSIEKEKGKKAYMIFSPKAYTKMMYLISANKDEVGWHGFVKRKKENVFYIYDIEVYPQIVTGATVETDEVEYPNWIGIMAENDSFFDLRFHGHSHVNMSCTPSSTDLNNRNAYLTQFKDNSDKDMFYLFVIMNKRGEHTAEIYDYTNNIVYENDDIFIDVKIDDSYISKWGEETKELVQKKIMKPSKEYLMELQKGDWLHEQYFAN